jgi:hypothetical protein
MSIATLARRPGYARRRLKAPKIGRAWVIVCWAPVRSCGNLVRLLLLTPSTRRSRCSCNGALLLRGREVVRRRGNDTSGRRLGRADGRERPVIQLALATGMAGYGDR